jgi:hypothetical protein
MQADLSLQRFRRMRTIGLQQWRSFNLQQLGIVTDKATHESRTGQSGHIPVLQRFHLAGTQTQLGSGLFQRHSGLFARLRQQEPGSMHREHGRGCFDVF